MGRTTTVGRAADTSCCPQLSIPILTLHAGQFDFYDNAGSVQYTSCWGPSGVMFFRNGDSALGDWSAEFIFAW